jgi:hypothetical protein
MRTGSMVRGHPIGVMIVVLLEMPDPIMTIFDEGSAAGNTTCECDVLPYLLRRRDGDLSGLNCMLGPISTISFAKHLKTTYTAERMTP